MFCTFEYLIRRLFTSSNDRKRSVAEMRHAFVVDMTVVLEEISLPKKLMYGFHELSNYAGKYIKPHIRNIKVP